MFSSVDRDVSILMARFRLGYGVMLGVALVFLVQALTLATAAAGSVDAQATQTLQAVDDFQTMWQLGLCLFGVHLILLGILVVRSGFAPRLLGFVLAFAGVTYAADTIAHVVVADYSTVSGLVLPLVAVSSVVGEGWLGIWLLTTRRLPEEVEG